MKNLIINADDFGLTNDISDAIIYVFKMGNLSSTTLMTNMPSSSYAIKLAKENPKLGVGLHFNISEGKSSIGVSSLTNSKGFFLEKMPLILKIFFNKVNNDDIRDELYNQYNYLIKAGISPTHIDSHQHIHMNPKVFKIVADFAKEKDIKIRITFPDIVKRIKGKFNYKKIIKQLILKYAAEKNKKYADLISLKYNKSFNSIFDFHPFQLPKVEDYKKLIESSKSDSHELMVHPYKISDQLKYIYLEKFENKKVFFEKACGEMKILSSKNIFSNFNLITYKDL
jgi:hypothetical protein